MKKSKTIDRADDPNLIPGIYNYCNRWCERCSFTARCMNYEGEEAADPGSDRFWQRIHESFEETQELLQGIAEQQGIDFDDFTGGQAIGGESEPGIVDAREDDLSRAAMKYGDLVEAWFDAHEQTFERAQNWLDQNFQLGIREEETREVATQTGDAIEVIRWYQHQVYVKLMRALSGKDDWPDRPGREDRLSDTDGSAKVALIAMDDSLAAWGRLQSYVPELSDEILDVMFLLEKLRRNTEKKFPHARHFVRPGFDE